MPSVRSSLWATGGGLAIDLINSLSNNPAVQFKFGGDIDGRLLTAVRANGGTG
jgi:hypothetical protein